MKIIVLNLHRNTKSSQLYKLFKKYGKVDSCNLVMDKEKDKSKGFGFVEMSDDDDANKAIAALNGTQLDNHKIRVKISTNTADTK